MFSSFKVFKDVLEDLSVTRSKCFMSIITKNLPFILWPIVFRASCFMF